MKKITSLLLTLALLFTLAVTVPVYAEQALTAQDALIVLQASVGAITLTPAQMERYFITGTPTTINALTILRISVGLEQPPASGTPILPPVEEPVPPADEEPAPPAEEPEADPRDISRTIHFGQLRRASYDGLSYLISNSGSITVDFTEEFQDIIFNLTSFINLSDCIEISLNGFSANGQAEIIFYNMDGREAVVMRNNRVSGTGNWTKTLTQAERNNTIRSMTIKSADGSNISVKIDSITFYGIN
jgi:hypothetical protein